MPNQFKRNDSVKQLKNVNGPCKTGGIVRYIACAAATSSGGRTCKKSTCAHYSAQDYVWVEWQDGTTFSYHYSELAYDNASPAISTGSPAPMQIHDEQTKPAPGVSEKELAALEAFTKKVVKKLSANDPSEQRVLQNDEVDFNRYNGFIKTPRGVPYSYRKGE